MKIYQFLEVKFFIYLNRRVFVMKKAALGKALPTSVTDLVAQRCKYPRTNCYKALPTKIFPYKLFRGNCYRVLPIEIFPY